MAIKEFITKQDAVSYLMGLGAALDQFTVLELASAVAEEADANAENWVVDNPDKLSKSLLNGMANIAEMRENLVNQFENLIEDMVVQAETLQIMTRLQDQEVLIEYDSFAEWAGSKLYIELPVRKAKKIIDAKWEDVTIKIKDTQKLQVIIKNRKPFYLSFADMRLMAVNKYDPNRLGLILIGMSHRKRYPPLSEENSDKFKVNISKLNKNIKENISISDTTTPIFYDRTNGYLPRFKLINDERSRDKRAKNDAVHVQYNELFHSENEYTFDDEEDEAGNFLKQTLD